MADTGLVDLTAALLVLFARSARVRLIDNFSGTGHLFSNSSGSILMFKAHLASQLFTTLNLQLFRAIFPLAFLPLHIPLPFQTFRRNELINKSVYYLSKEVDDGFADIIGSEPSRWSLATVGHHTML